MAHDNTRQVLELHKLKQKVQQQRIFWRKNVAEPVGYVNTLLLLASPVRLRSFGAKQANTLPTQSHY